MAIPMLPPGLQIFRSRDPGYCPPFLKDFNKVGTKRGNEPRSFLDGIFTGNRAQIPRKPNDIVVQTAQFDKYGLKL